MLSLVTAAEQQYRFDTASRAREDAVLRSIRDRELGLVTEVAHDRATRRARETRKSSVAAQRATTVCATA